MAALPYRGRVAHLTQMIDLFPTFVEIAGAVPANDLDGQSLLPFLAAGASPTHKDAVVSQFHGENLAMSWYCSSELLHDVATP